MAKKRTHKARQERLNQGLSHDQIRANKCERSKMRTAKLREERLTVINERLEHWRSLGLEEQLKALDARLGKGKGAGKQRARIAEAIKERDKAAAKAEEKKPQTSKKKKRRQRKGR